MTRREGQSRQAVDLFMFPITFSLAWVLGVFGISTAPLGDLWRPLAIAGALALAWTAVAGFIARGKPGAKLTAGTLWVGIITTWWVAAIIPALAAIRLLFLRRRPRVATRISTTAWTARMANTLGVALCIVGAFGVMTSGAISAPSPQNAAAAEDSGGPNIYLVLLDGYPRADTLREDFGINNEPFLASLRAAGFAIADDSHANYPTTLLTLASMLHMTYVEDIPRLQGAPRSPTGQVRSLTAAINDAPALDLLRDSGYRIITVPSWYGDATLSSADEVRNSGHLTIFEEQVLRLSTGGQVLLSTWPNLVADQQRGRTTGAFEQLGQIAASAGGPTFVLVHIFSPHAPLLFQADGSALDPPPCYPARCSFNITNAETLGMTVAEYGAALRGHLRHLNELVRASVADIIANDPDAVVVLFSDHGARHDDDDTEEHFRTLLAARTPDRGGLVEEMGTPVNILPVIFNAYLGTELPVRAPRTWIAEPATPLQLSPVEWPEAAP